LDGERDVLACVLANPVNVAVLDGLAALDIPDAWLASGAIFQSVWNGVTGRGPEHGVLDYDVIYFDPDTSWEAEDAVIKRCDEAFAHIRADIQVRNQARVPLWYPQKYGGAYPPLKDAAESLERYLAPCCSVAVRKTGYRIALAAPFGLADTLGLRVRKNRLTTGPREQYEKKAGRWKTLWPEIKVEPWPDT
jgi:uncharacterized protein